MASATKQTSSAASRGKAETDLLRSNIKDQLDRLFTQLEDLEELKDEFEQNEYIEQKQETIDQLRDFQAFMEKSLAGDMTLIDEFGAAQLAIQAAVSQAFKTPEVIRMFAQKQPDQLRARLATLQRELKLKHSTNEDFNRQAVEIMSALKQLNVSLTKQEKSFLDTISSARHMESAVDKLGSGTQQTLMSAASQQIKKAAK